MDLGRAFGYVTEDERWLSKTLVGGLVYVLGAFIIVGPIIFLGYMVEVVRNILRGNPRPLPEWDNWGQKLSEGFKLIVISIVYYLPLILVACVIGLLAGLAAGSGDSDAAGAASGLVACMQALLQLLQIALLPFIVAGWARYIQTGDLSAALRFGDVFGMVRSQPGAWIILALVQMLCGIVAAAGLILFCVGIFLTYPYAQLVFAHAMAQTIAKTGGLQTDAGTPPSYTPPSYTPPTY
jgi:hypothetical protein